MMSAVIIIIIIDVTKVTVIFILNKRAGVLKPFSYVDFMFVMQIKPLV